MQRRAAKELGLKTIASEKAINNDKDIEKWLLSRWLARVVSWHYKKDNRFNILNEKKCNYMLNLKFRRI